MYTLKYTYMQYTGPEIPLSSIWPFFPLEFTKFTVTLFCTFVHKLNELNEPTGLHFNLPGHNISIIMASILEECFHSTTTYRKQREEFFIQAFQTKFKGMNKKLLTLTPTQKSICLPPPLFTKRTFSNFMFLFLTTSC